MDVLVCSNCGFAGKVTEMKACARCRGAHYCDKECQSEHWKKHKRLCKHLNVGDAQQLNCNEHETQALGEDPLSMLASNPLHIQRLYKIFMSKDVSDQAFSKMVKIVKKMPMWERNMVMFQSLHILLKCFPLEMLELRTSPLLVVLSCGVDPSAWSAPRPPAKDKNGSTPLHWVAEMADASDFRSLENQVILGRQLLDAGADVIARTNVGRGRVTPLHRACSSACVTNLDFIRLLLDRGADPNIGCVPGGETPLMHTLDMATSAAKLLLTYPSIVPIDVDTRTDMGSTFLGGVRYSLARQRAHAKQPRDARTKYIIKQLKALEALAVAKNGIDGGWGMSRESYAFSAEKDRELEQEEDFLSFTVSALLGKDELLKDGPEWYKQVPFWIDDGLSIQSELHKKMPYLHSGCNKGTFRHVNKAPAAGQGVEIYVKLPNTLDNDINFGRLSGNVTEVFPAPTERSLKKAKSFMYRNACPCDNPRCSITRHGTYDEIVKKFGAVHGQEVKATVSLNKKDAKYIAFFGATTLYDILLRCNDSKQNMWEVVRISKHTGN